MQSEEGTATVPVAPFGVSPNGWSGRFHSSFGASGRGLPAHRRDADESDRDDRAPHLQRYCSSMERHGEAPVSTPQSRSAQSRIDLRAAVRTLFAVSFRHEISGAK